MTATLPTSRKLPVVTANTVLRWHALRSTRASGSVEGYGDIFSRELQL